MRLDTAIAYRSFSAGITTVNFKFFPVVSVFLSVTAGNRAKLSCLTVLEVIGLIVCR
jgi:hypothetical protein